MTIYGHWPVDCNGVQLECRRIRYSPGLCGCELRHLQSFLHLLIDVNVFFMHIELVRGFLLTILHKYN